MRRTLRSFLLATLPLLSLVAHAGQFKKAVYYSAGERPHHVITAHLTDSGNADLILGDYVSNQIVVLLGNGDGSFQEPLQFRAPSPIDLAAGDFNEDGNQDLVVVENGGTGDGALAVFLGDGKGGFKLSGTYLLGAISVSVAVADFNGDGHLDVAVTNQRGTVMTFFGDGHGKLRDRISYKVTGAPVGIAAGDLNGDHHPDLAVTQFNKGSIAVLLNDGTGHFGTPVSYNAGGGEVVDVKIADLRHDGKKDLVVANGSLSAVGVLLNKGDGTFAPVKLYPTHSDVEAVVVADFNLDGHLDVAVAAHIDNSALLYGKGDGTFGPPVLIKDEIGTDGGYSLAVGDFNHDGAPDLAIPIELKGKVAILLNTQ